MEKDFKNKFMNTWKIIIISLFIMVYISFQNEIMLGFSLIILFSFVVYFIILAIELPLKGKSDFKNLIYRILFLTINIGVGILLIIFIAMLLSTMVDSIKITPNW